LAAYGFSAGATLVAAAFHRNQVKQQLTKCKLCATIINTHKHTHKHIHFSTLNTSIIVIQTGLFDAMLLDKPFLNVLNELKDVRRPLTVADRFEWYV
jgi:hypothetical protein